MTRVIRDFRTITELIARGRLVEKLDAQILNLIEALEDSDDDKSKASLQLTLTFQRIGEKTDIRATYKATPPPDKPLPAVTLFNVEGGLSLQHPSQIDMFAGPRDAAAREVSLTSRKD